jgi:outer membrane protein TolC
MSNARELNEYRLLASAAIALALLGGGACAVDQNREVAIYRQVIDQPAGTQPSTLPSTRPAADAPLSLRDALLLANLLNETLAHQGETYLQALIAENRAAAAFMPTVSLAPAINWSKQQGTGLSAVSFGGSSFALGGSNGVNRNINVPIQAQGNLFNGMGDVAAQREAHATSEEQRQLLLDQQATLLLNVAQTYYSVLRAEAQVRVLNHSLELQGERVRDMQARVALGDARPLDVAQTLGDQAGTRVSLLTAGNSVRDSRYSLANLLGVPVVDGPLLDDFQPPDPLPAVAEFQNRAQSDRQDLLAAHAAVAAARQGVQVAVSKYYPSISANVQYLLYGQPSGQTLWSLALQGTMPIFSAGTIEADVRTAWSRYRQAVLDDSRIARQSDDDVRTAYDNSQSSARKIIELKAQVAANHQAYDLAERSYALGGTTNLDRLTAQDNLLNAQLQLVSEEYNYKIYYLDLLRATGHFGLGETARAIAQGQHPATQPATTQGM